MDLEQFVSPTLVQIRKGIIAANQELADPDPTKAVATFRLPAPGTAGGLIEFDVAVTVPVTGSSTAQAKAGIKAIEGEIDGRIQGSREQASRMQFAVMTLR